MRVVTVLRLKVAFMCLSFFTYFKVFMGNVSPFVQINVTTCITTIGKNVAP